MPLREKLIKLIKSNDIHKIATAVVAQGMLSVTNFAIGIVIAKYALKEEYGLYVLLFSFIGILSGYHSALINSPLLVLINDKTRDKKDIYVASLAVGRNYLFIPLLLLFSMALVLYYVMVVGDYRYVYVSIFMSVVIMMFNSKEFFRTIHFTLLNTNTIFMMDLIMLIVVLAGICFIILNDSVNAFSGLMLLCLGYTCSYVYAKAKNPYKRKKNLEIKAALRENWAYAKWLFLGIHASIIKNRSYIYIITAILGLGALADVSASRLFLMPLILLKDSVAKIMISKGSLMVSRGEERKFKIFILYFVATLLLICIVYFVILLLISDVLIGFLGGKYSNIKSLIILWGMYVLVGTIKSTIATSLIVYKRFKQLALYDIVGAIVVIITCFLFVLFVGNYGAIISLIVGEIILMVLYVKLFLKLEKKPEPDMVDLELERVKV